MLRILPALALTMVLAAASPGVHTRFAGGTLALPVKTGIRLDVTSGDALVLAYQRLETRVPYARINTLEYGQNVSRRYAAAILVSPVLLLSKTRKHFLTLGYTDAEDRQQALVLRIDKGDIRSVLAALEARTGKRVVNLDDEARKGNR